MSSVIQMFDKVEGTQSVLFLSDLVSDRSVKENSTMYTQDSMRSTLSSTHYYQLYASHGVFV